jgi:hypothetical protein
MRLRCDDINPAQSLQDKVLAITAFLNQGSVLVYANEDLNVNLKEAHSDLVFVESNTNPQALRNLDRLPYKLLIAPDSFGMRGIDYRSKSNPLFLVIAKQFPTTREAL